MNQLGKRLPINPNKWFTTLTQSINALYNTDFKNSKKSQLEKTLSNLLLTNFKIWGYEDEARRRDLPDKAIANLKRNIDKENQKRHDLIDTIDAVLREDAKKRLKFIDDSLPMNSETPGSIFDRLTILALRTYSLKKEIKRKDANKSHIERCFKMLKEVEERSQDLLNCIAELLEDIFSGRKRLKSYKQHKLYNDPNLNPALRK